MSAFKQETLPSGIEIKAHHGPLDFKLEGKYGQWALLTKSDINRMHGIAFPEKRRTGVCHNLPEQLDVPDINVGDSQPAPIIPEEAMWGITQLVTVCHTASVNKGWYHDINTGEKIERNKAEMICLMHSELSEAMEGIRKDLQDDKLPHRKMAEVELADTIIRICDFAGMMGYDLAGAIKEKLEYNSIRPDHKRENRLKAGGKAF